MTAAPAASTSHPPRIEQPTRFLPEGFFERDDFAKLLAKARGTEAEVAGERGKAWSLQILGAQAEQVRARDAVDPRRRSPDGS